jgi:hypothetical protein
MAIAAVVLGTGSRAIRGVRASFSPASAARTDDESTVAREKIEQVGPEPNSNFVDRSHQRTPVLNTNGMPFSAARSETERLPGYFLRRGFGRGSNGSINAHSSSSMIGVPIPLVAVIQMAKVPERLTAPSGSF